MKRPPGIWILLSAGVLCLCLEDVNGVRATALIFGKTSTTTTTTEESISHESSDETATEINTEPTSNTTKPTLTGIPQVDYIWDPNLPKELNGYNLSTYPFYERVPEDIDFKCDGLHDGFYASVLHKCQVYHHCLFGTRYDFLCANYTAFDQKTFICHFVSEVDCVNSKKYWHRNDALYQAATTTTTSTTTTTTVRPKTESAPPLRPAGNRRRPLRRRRPQFDYYEYADDYEYYDERPARVEPRRRKRPRPRPIYDDDEYEEYEDDRYVRRGHTRREEERNRNRRPPTERRRNQERRKYEDEERFEEDDRRYYKKRPSEDEDGSRRSRPKEASTRKPLPEDDYQEEKKITPTSGSSIYNRPRTAPRIKPPVPKNEANKYAYDKKTPAVEEYDDQEYQEDEEEEPRPKHGMRSRQAPRKEYDDYEEKPSTKEPQIVRIVKRPFLPSRGGNPYSRGLQPVGTKSHDHRNATEETMELKANQQSVVIKMPVNEFKPAFKQTGPRTTQKPKVPDVNQLDEYDVTLNDALNPTLPNLPVRGYPTGFSNDYYKAPLTGYQRTSHAVVPYQVHELGDAEFKKPYRPRVTQAFLTRFQKK